MPPRRREDYEIPVTERQKRYLDITDRFDSMQSCLEEDAAALRASNDRGSTQQRSSTTNRLRKKTSEPFKGDAQKEKLQAKRTIEALLHGDSLKHRLKSPELSKRNSIKRKTTSNENVDYSTKHTPMVQLVRAYLQENMVFRRIPLDPNTPPSRDALPSDHDPKTYIKIWQLIKNSIGKDLTKMTLPVTINEPLSLTQKVLVILEYQDLIVKAAQSGDSLLRMGYVLAAHFLSLSSNAFSAKKPFNSLLGETYELVTPDFRGVSEQVSHHPPVTAYFIDSAFYTVAGDFSVQVLFGFSGIQVMLLGDCHITLKTTNETFEIKNPRGSAHNYLMGTPYTWFDSELTCRNTSTNEIARVTYRSKNKKPEKNFEIDGTIADSAGTVAYKLSGKWNSHLVGTAV